MKRVGVNRVLGGFWGSWEGLGDDLDFGVYNTPEIYRAKKNNICVLDDTLSF
jgi:hypothetical protein